MQQADLTMDAAHNEESDIPQQMTAMVIHDPGESARLVQETVDVPTPGPGEVLIRVEAAAVNRPDLLQMRGMHFPPDGVTDKIPGLDIAGEVVTTGPGLPDASWLQKGTRICALVGGGGYAEYCIAPIACCLPLPDGLSAVEAASLPETFFTAWTNLFDRGQLQRGNSVLIHGGTSGVGVAAIQLAAHYAGARVFTTAGTAEKCEATIGLGADYAFNYREEDWETRILELTEGHGVEVVLDMVGGDYLNRNLNLLADYGRHVSIAFLRGMTPEVNLKTVMDKRLTLTGSMLRRRPMADKAAIADALRTHVWPLVDAGKIKPVIYAEYPLTQATDAHSVMQDGKHIGKLVLTV
ncbi:MAG: NAD(P)H-quinone oxidoreductase [Alphaproteobacteria bacterium]